jgi:hypothetical protein
LLLIGDLIRPKGIENDCSVLWYGNGLSKGPPITYLQDRDRDYAKVLQGDVSAIRINWLPPVYKRNIHPDAQVFMSMTYLIR